VAAAVPDPAAGPISTRVSSAPAAAAAATFRQDEKQEKVQETNTRPGNPIRCSEVSKWRPTNLEDLQAVLPLTLLDHGDEPHDDVERQQDPTRPQQVHLQSEARDNC